MRSTLLKQGTIVANQSATSTSGASSRQVGSPLNEQSGCFRSIFLSGKAQGRRTTVGTRIDQTSRVQEQLNGFHRVAVRRIVQRCPSRGMSASVGIRFVL
jgi:hypothetical protein